MAVQTAPSLTQCRIGLASILSVMIAALAILAADVRGQTAGPAVVAVTPSSAGGPGTQTFSLLYSDPNGYGYIYAAQVIINGPLGYTGSCSVLHYPANTVYLI